MVLSKKVESLITSFTIVTNITILPIGTKRNSSKYTEELCILFYFKDTEYLQKSSEKEEVIFILL